MSITGVSQQTYGIYNSPVVEKDSKNAITPEYMLESIRNLGVASVRMDDCEHRSVLPLEYNGISGVHVFIAPSMMERLINDADFREQQFEILRQNVEVMDTFLDSGQEGTHKMLIAMNQLSGGASQWSLSDLTHSNMTEDSALYYEKATVATLEQGSGYSLSESLIQKFSAQFAASGDLLTTAQTSSVQEYIDKMRQHMPPSDMVNTGGTWHSSNITVTQNRYDGTSEATSNAPIRNIPPHLFATGVGLYDSLRHIATAFAAVVDELGSSALGSQQLESAFWHILRNTHGLTAHLARLNLGGESAADLDAETIAQMHEEAREQLELFGETFLEKFKQYGLEDGFSVAWAKLTNPISAVATMAQTSATIELPSEANNYGLTAAELATFKQNHNGFTPMEIELRQLNRELFSSIPDHYWHRAAALGWFERQAQMGNPVTSTTITVFHFDGRPPTKFNVTKAEAQHAFNAIPGMRKTALLQLKSEAEEGSLRMAAIMAELERMEGIQPTTISTTEFNSFIPPQSMTYEDYLDEGLAQIFMEAVAEFRNRMLRGNALTEEEIQERIAEFREKFAPEEPATQQQLDDFYEKLNAYYLHLRELGTATWEDLLVFSMLEDDE